MERAYAWTQLSSVSCSRAAGGMTDYVCVPDGDGGWIDSASVELTTAVFASQALSGKKTDAAAT